MDTDTYVRVPPAGVTGGHTRLADTARSARPAIAAMELVRRQDIHGDDSCSTPHESESAGARARDGCPVLELTVERADGVFVFVHGTRDGMSRLSPGTCSRAGEAVTGVSGKRTYRFPAARFPGSDWPTVYAIAVSGSELTRQFTGLLQVLPDACDNASGMRADSNGMDRWLNRLDRLIAASGEHAVWTARRIP
jgi:hypothetical protein